MAEQAVITPIQRMGYGCGGSGGGCRGRRCFGLVTGSAGFITSSGMVTRYRQATTLVTEQAVVTPIKRMGYGCGDGGGGRCRSRRCLGLMAGSAVINGTPGMVEP